MSLLVTGEIEHIIDRPVSFDGKSWTEHTLVVKDWGATLYLVASREMNEAGLPDPGSKVALEAGVRAYNRKDGGAGYGLTAIRRNAEAEKALYGVASVGAVASS